jgi:NAD-dependent SIR2 family protein deacetylase
MSDQNIALIVGAGASKAFNFPLTREILPIILGKIKGGTLFGSDDAAIQDRSHLTIFLEQILPGVWLEDTGHLLITELLSLIDHMILTSTVPFPKADISTLSSVRVLLERAIFEALEWTYDPAEEKSVPVGLTTLAKWIYEYGLKSRCALISTNYDECIETELYRCLGSHEEVNQKIDFGLSWREFSTGQIFHSLPNANYGIFKLHGSVGWLKCELCNWVTCNDEYVYRKEPFSVLSYIQHSSVTICACGHSPLRSVIVAPSTVRDIRDTNLLSVWKAAFEALRAADHWYIIGYSMPTEDVAIRSMLVRAFNGREVEPTVEVIQYGDDKQTRARYELYFKSCKYHEYGMQGFVDNIKQGLI